MEKLTGILLLLAVAFRLIALFFFSQSAFLKQFSLLTFIIVAIVAVVLLVIKWFRWRSSK